MRTNKMIIIVLIAVIVIIGIGAGFYTISEIKKSEVLEIRVANLSISCPTSVPPPKSSRTARMHIKLMITNPNDVEVTLDEYYYDVCGNGHSLGRVKAECGYEGWVIPSFGTMNTSSPLPYVCRDAVGEDMWFDVIKGKVTWKIKGVADIRFLNQSLNVPFECVIKKYSLRIHESCL